MRYYSVVIFRILNNAERFFLGISVSTEAPHCRLWLLGSLGSFRSALQPNNPVFQLFENFLKFWIAVDHVFEAHSGVLNADRKRAVFLFGVIESGIMKWQRIILFVLVVIFLSFLQYRYPICSRVVVRKILNW